MKYFSIIAIIVIVTGGSSVKYSAKDAYIRLENDTTEIIDSEEFGSIQYKIINNDGIPVLIIHGIIGGYDQGIQTGISLLPNNQKILSISRFGYLESNLPKNPTPINQCKAYIEALDQSNIDKVFIIATSAGGTIALKFAILYPERITGIILIGSGYPTPDLSKGPTGPPSFIYRDFIFEFMLNNMQGTLLNMFGVTKKEYEMVDLNEKNKLNNLFNTILPINPRRKGIINDEKVINPDMSVNFSDYVLEEIDCPVLILHAKNDPMAKYEEMQTASKRFKNFQIILYETGGHVLFGHDEETRRHISNFILQNSN